MQDRTLVDDDSQEVLVRRSFNQFDEECLSLDDLFQSGQFCLGDAASARCILVDLVGIQITEKPSFRSHQNLLARLCG